mmetsp:Transcript_89130/g.238741  ORF Transcript_89130/g.238741 Transcript_89130/m.238741 type:complete len:219 (+) Transcript_89130:1542-2198(+)
MAGPAPHVRKEGIPLRIALVLVESQTVGRYSRLGVPSTPPQHEGTIASGKLTLEQSRSVVRCSPKIAHVVVVNCCCAPHSHRALSLAVANTSARRHGTAEVLVRLGVEPLVGIVHVAGLCFQWCNSSVDQLEATLLVPWGQVAPALLSQRCVSFNGYHAIPSSKVGLTIGPVKEPQVEHSPDRAPRRNLSTGGVPPAPAGVGRLDCPIRVAGGISAPQ